MADQMEIPVALGQRLKRRRLELNRTQVQVAVGAGISASYFSEIENGTTTPPPTNRMEKILSALEFCGTETHELLQLASISRGLAYGEAELPPEVQALIRDIRLHAYDMSPRFIKGLRTKIREVVS